MGPLRVMHAAFDAAIGDAVDQFALDREREREIFIAMLGHDLREPLSAILAGAELLVAAGNAGAVVEHVKVARQISTSATRMSKMIGELLDFARGRVTDGFPVVMARVDARTLIRDTIAELSHAHPGRTIECIQGAGDFEVEWDGERMVQAISNLVSNALGHGGDPIVIESIDEGDRITVHVRNRGEIPSHMIPHLFSPFSNSGANRSRDDAKAEANRRRGSLGLGLYIVREITRAHGGAVAVSSVAGETDISITLPRHPRQAEPSHPAA